MKELYKNNPVNATRIKTDALFVDDEANISFAGQFDKAIRHIENVQLLDAELWARFVEQFRVHSDDCGGWRGEYWGKMMRGAAFTYSYTKNEQLYKILTYSVEDMISTQEQNGRISTFKSEKEFFSWDIWCRKYVLLGMQYYLEICSDESFKARIIESMKKQVDYLMQYLGKPEKGKMLITEASNNWRGLNSSSILEPVVRLYDITQEKCYLDFAKYIIDCGGTTIANVFRLAYEDKCDPYQYPITKAYELISCFEGLLEYYRATCEEWCKKAAVNFARRLGQSDITIIGSAGCTHEYLDHAALRQTDTAYSGIMQETCVTVTWMKFCHQLLLLTGDPYFADHFERSLYNAYFGSFNTENNVDKFVLERFPEAVLEPLPFDSYSSLISNTRGRGIGGLMLMPDNHYYGCCACIGSAGTGLIAKTAMLLARDGIVINLYSSGSAETATPSGAKIKMDIDTEYPKKGSVKITLGLEKSEEFCLYLRNPEWSRKTSVCVNGQSTAVNSGYIKLDNKWNDGDTIVLDLDMRARVICAPSDPKDVIIVDINWKYDYVTPRVVYESDDAKYHIALQRGPIVLARDARLGENVDTPVDILFDSEGTAELIPANSADFDTVEEYRVKQKDGSTFSVIDYSSAGKTWNEQSKYCCWFNTKK